MNPLWGNNSCSRNNNYGKHRRDDIGRVFSHSYTNSLFVLGAKVKVKTKRI